MDELLEINGGEVLDLQEFLFSVTDDWEMVEVLESFGEYAHLRVYRPATKLDQLVQTHALNLSGQLVELKRPRVPTGREIWVCGWNRQE